MAGARHNKKDMQLINDSRGKLREIDANLLNLGAQEDEQPTQQETPAEDMPAMDEQEPEAAMAKSALWLTDKIARVSNLAVKAAGDWELDVLGIPFGGPDDRDSDRQYFSEKTELYLQPGEVTPVFYYHGVEPDSRHTQPQPEQIGTARFLKTDDKGHWFRVTLDRAKDFAQRVWNAAKQGIARASSGSIAHLARIDKSGEILSWPFAELSVFDTGQGREPANPNAIVTVAKATFTPRIDQPEATVSKSGAADNQQAKPKGILDMERDELLKLLDERDAAKASAAKAAADRQAEIDLAVKVEIEKKEKEWAAKNRLPYRDGAPTIAQFSDEWAYDNLDAGDQAVLVGVLESAKRSGRSRDGASVSAYKALARKLEDDKSRVGEVSRQAMKRAAIKANEVDYSTLASYGDEWVGIAYSQTIWDAIRAGTFVAAKIPSTEIPQGLESMYLPLEGTDPTWYKVAENTTYDSTMKIPVPTVTSSQMGTARVLMTLAKMGARVLWTGELEERSLVPFAAQLRMQLGVSGAEALENVLINGDTATSGNINDIGGTTYSGAATSLFLFTNGFRKSPLVTTTANSRSAAGTLTVDDYLNTVKLMGTAGINALDNSKVGFIIDPNTHWATLALSEIKTRDTFSSPTVEGGKLTGLWGYEINVSAQMHAASATRKANSAGKVDQDTAGNNLYGAILAVRYDQWRLGYQRRMSMETTRFANSDTNEIVAMMSAGLIQRDTEASAISYYVGV
jgi:hypothetical protein